MKYSSSFFPFNFNFSITWYHLNWRHREYSKLFYSISTESLLFSGMVIRLRRCSNKQNSPCFIELVSCQEDKQICMVQCWLISAVRRKERSTVKANNNKTENSLRNVDQKEMHWVMTFRLSTEHNASQNILWSGEWAFQSGEQWGGQYRGGRVRKEWGTAVVCFYDQHLTKKPFIISTIKG